MDKALERSVSEVEGLPEEERRRIVRVLEEEVRKARREVLPPSGRWAGWRSA